MAKYRLYFIFRWKARELGWGHQMSEFDAPTDSRAIRIARTRLQSKTTKISYELEKLTRVEETIVASNLPSKGLKQR
jgi:hypothetical protein